MAILLDHADAVPDGVVVRIGNVQEVDAASPKFGDRGQFVIRSERKMLHARGLIMPVEVFLDLALSDAVSGFVDRHLDQLIARGHDLRHQGRVFGGDVVVVEVLEEGEAHDVLVPLDPFVHAAFFDVADAVIEVHQSTRMFIVVGIDRVVAVGKARCEHTAVLDSGQREITFT